MGQAAKVVGGAVIGIVALTTVLNKLRVVLPGEGNTQNIVLGGIGAGLSAVGVAKHSPLAVGAGAGIIGYAALTGLQNTGAFMPGEALGPSQLPASNVSTGTGAMMRLGSGAVFEPSGAVFEPTTGEPYDGVPTYQGADVG